MSQQTPIWDIMRVENIWEQEQELVSDESEEEEESENFSETKEGRILSMVG